MNIMHSHNAELTSYTFAERPLGFDSELVSQTCQVKGRCVFQCTVTRRNMKVVWLKNGQEIKSRGLDKERFQAVSEGRVHKYWVFYALAILNYLLITGSSFANKFQLCPEMRPLRLQCSAKRLNLLFPMKCDITITCESNHKYSQLHSFDFLELEHILEDNMRIEMRLHHQWTNFS